MSEYTGNIDNVVEIYKELFKNFKTLTGEQKSAIIDTAKRRFLGFGKEKFFGAQYITKTALELINNKSAVEIPSATFTMEHVIPKTKYIFAPIQKILSECSFEDAQIEIEKIIRQRHIICYITNKQNRRLSSTISDNLLNKLDKSLKSGEAVSERELFERYFIAAKENPALDDEEIYKITGIAKKEGDKYEIQYESALKIKK